MAYERYIKYSVKSGRKRNPDYSDAFEKISDEISNARKWAEDYTGTYLYPVEYEAVRMGDNSDNYLYIDKDGTITLHGTATVYKDELQSLIKEGVNNPSAHIFRDYSEGTLDYKTSSDLNDYAIMDVQLNHGWAIGTTVFPHIHWFQNQDDTPNWLIQYRWQTNGEAKETTWTDYKLNTNIYTYGSGTILQISEGEGLAPPKNASLSDILQIRLLRDVANTSTLFTGVDTYTGDAEAVNFDIHYQINTIGSDTEYTK